MHFIFLQRGCYPYWALQRFSILMIQIAIFYRRRENKLQWTLCGRRREELMLGVLAWFIFAGICTRTIGFGLSPALRASYFPPADFPEILQAIRVERWAEESIPTVPSITVTRSVGIVAVVHEAAPGWCQWPGWSDVFMVQPRSRRSGV